MADYPTIPDPDPLESAAEHAARVLRATMPLTAKPSTRLDLEAAARRLEDAMAERTRT